MKPPTCTQCPEPAIDETLYKVGLCHEHAQKEMLRLDQILVKLHIEMEKLHAQSQLLQKAIHVHRNGLTKIAPAPAPGAEKITLGDLISAAIKGL